MANTAAVPDGLGGQLRQTLCWSSQLAQSIKSAHPVLTDEHSAAVPELILHSTYDIKH